MYINNLGMGRVSSIANTAAQTVNTSKTAARTSKKSGSYATAMKKAVDNQKSTVTSSYTSAGDIIIKEALEKMKTDPEWEESVMGKVKEFYAGDYSYAADRTQTNYLNLLNQNSLQNYMMQSLFGGLGTAGLTGYSSLGYGNLGYGTLASNAYRNVMNSSSNNSLLGSWQL